MLLYVAVLFDLLGGGSTNIYGQYANTVPICTMHNGVCVCVPVLQKERERSEQN